jgi:hypothetical protein
MVTIPTEASVALDHFEYRVKRMVPLALMGRTSAEAILDQQARSCILLITHVVLGKRGAVLRVPDTWWDHTKERWFPAWALRRWPVQYREHEARLLLPYLPLPTTREWESVAVFAQDPKA